MLTPDVWEIGLAPWIIQDGNYGEFGCGQTADFAVELYVPSLHPAPAGPMRAQHLHDGVYSIIAKVAFGAEGVRVLDFGLQGYQGGMQTIAAAVEPGDLVSADEVYLGVDPFFYFEDLHSRPGIPPLIYTWRIEQILMQTAPLIPGPERGPNGIPIMVRDPSGLGWREVHGTNAWEDDGGNADYLFRCTRLPLAPKYCRGIAR